MVPSLPRDLDEGFPLQLISHKTSQDGQKSKDGLLGFPPSSHPNTNLGAAVKRFCTYKSIISR